LNSIDAVLPEKRMTETSGSSYRLSANGGTIFWFGQATRKAVSVRVGVKRAAADCRMTICVVGSTCTTATSSVIAAVPSERIQVFRAAS
jgi:hypothetical protein